MLKNRPWPSLVIVGAALAAAGGAWAAGFGASAPSAVLGQPLDFTVQMRLDAGETLTSECIAAEVTLGDRRLLPTQVRTAVDVLAPDNVRVHVRTSAVVDEPVVAVVLNAGCQSRVSRRFVVMADPPMDAPMAPPMAAAPSAAAAFAPAFAAAPPDAVLPAGSNNQAADVGAARAAVVLPVGAVRRVALRETRRAPARAAAPVGTARQARAAARAQRRAAAAGTATSKNQSQPQAQALRQVRRAATAVAAAAAAPRLKLDAAEPGISIQTAVLDQALEAVAQAASATRAAASAASAASDRIAQLERSVDSLRGEAKANRDIAAQLRERMAAAGDGSRWLWPLLGAVLVLLAVTLWLALRLAAAQRARQLDWQAAAAPMGAHGVGNQPTTLVGEASTSRQPTAPIPFVTSQLQPHQHAHQYQQGHQQLHQPGRQQAHQQAQPPEPMSARSRPAVPEPPVTVPAAAPPPAVSPAPPAPAQVDASDDNRAMQRTEVLPHQGRSDEAGARDVSIEELIDLEQQAEFFVVLGQDDAAIELLAEHLRQTGGGSPLPYLKLLEIYRRRGDRNDYERARSRFNQRFNAYAPDWDVDLQSGRALEAYPGILPRLQQVWSRPLDAMAELEALLFRKSRGDLFELPAYREVLFLYALSRDLLDHEAADTGNVDLLLPLSDGGEFSSTSPAPFLGLQRDLSIDRAEFDDRPTAPVDFDLSSESGPPTSIFDPLDALEERPRRR